ncbi:MAG: hypothetical protein A2341_09435 [Deltaproteobacteria bacterium RIFOXYB12_FULL_58_9]|nr:MAG: hypothetical protein A2341_09435 [Deltaproteobacteria bacterium RIFOXYB12_FULL_58_9]
MPNKDLESIKEIALTGLREVGCPRDRGEPHQIASRSTWDEEIVLDAPTRPPAVIQVKDFIAGRRSARHPKRTAPRTGTGVALASLDHFSRYTEGIPIPGKPASDDPSEVRDDAGETDDAEIAEARQETAVWQPWMAAGNSANLGVHAAQDRQRLIDTILAKVAQVMPLVYWKLNRTDAIYGTVLVRFLMSRNGYVDGFKVVESQGDRDIELAAYHALILASPYVYAPGWIELTLVFQR